MALYERSLALQEAHSTNQAGRIQPEQADWDCLGYGNNAIYEVEVHVR